MKEPQRLFAEGGRLAQAIGDARARTPDPSSLAKIASGLSQHGAHVAPPDTGSAIAAKAGWSGATKAWLTLSGFVALGIVGALLAQDPSAAVGTAPRSPEVAAAPDSKAPVPAVPSSTPTAVAGRAGARAPNPERAEAEATRVPDLPEVTAKAPVTPRSAAPEQLRREASGPSREVAQHRAPSTDASDAKVSPSAKSQEADSATSAETEISLLKRAREALARNPGTSFALAQEHRAAYPRGRLSQEREVIAITALARLGQPSSARERAEQFRRAYPRSAYLGQLDRIVGEN